MEPNPEPELSFLNPVPVKPVQEMHLEILVSTFQFGTVLLNFEIRKINQITTTRI
jgi:hypothetical protein